MHLSKVLDLHVASELAFFLAIVPFQSKLFASYRISLSSWETNVVELDATFHPHGKVLSIPETEDARVIIYDDKIWLIDNHVDFPRKMTSWDNSVRVTLDESRLGASFFRGKNWAPFVYNKNLYFVYSLEPLRVLLCIWPEGRLEWVYGQDSKSDTDKLYVRGGSNAIVFNGHVYGVGRESFYIKRQDCKGEEIHDSKQHFPVLWSFPLSVLFKASHSVFEKLNPVQIRRFSHTFTRGVNDPTSLFVLESRIYVVISSCSCDCVPEVAHLNENMTNTLYEIKPVGRAAE